MRKHYQIKCYVNKDELEKIRKQAEENGFSSSSSYLRFLAKTSMFSMHGKINVIYENIVKK